jgi:molybdopterin-guanine dinucleotide biosynthesis protein A
VLNDSTPPPRLVVGIFAGGRATRLGGIAKGLLEVPGTEQSIVARLAGLSRGTVPDGEVVLVGGGDAYHHLGLPALVDAPDGVGPLGGLLALLEHALERRASAALALACDMPRVTGPLLERLSAHAPHADAVAPHIDDKWQPLFARYRPAPSLAAARRCLESKRYGLFRVLEALGDGVARLPLTAAEAGTLDDWDEPGDLMR